MTRRQIPSSNVAPSSRTPMQSGLRLWVSPRRYLQPLTHKLRLRVPAGLFAIRLAGLAVACLLALAAARAASPASAPASRPTTRPARGIVFCSDRSGPWRLWTCRPDGSKLKQLTRAEDEAHDVDPVWAPDGLSVFYTSTRAGKTGVWKLDLASARATRICDGDQAGPAPAGGRIAFRRKGKILVRDLRTRKEKIISGPLPACSGPAWSGDGRLIAFASRSDSRNAIYIVGLTDTKPRKVYDRKGACEPHFAPDGKRLVYETETNICTIGVDGKKNRPVTWYGGVQRYGRFSPDGKRIIFCQGPGPRGPWQLYVVPA